MNPHFPTLDEPATPEYALAVLRNAPIATPGDDPRHPGASFDSTIAQWRTRLGGTGDAGHLGENFNTIFAIKRSPEEWRAVIEPNDRKTLRDVCEFVARHAVRPRIRPAKVRGMSDRVAGAFLTVRSLLHAAGAKAARIRPDSKLAPYTFPHLNVFLGDLRRIAPGVLPPATLSVSSPGAKLGLALAMGGPAAFFGVCSGHPLIGAIGVATLVVSLAVVWWPHRRGLGTFRFGDLETFADLSVLLAGSEAMIEVGSDAQEPARR